MSRQLLILAQFFMLALVIVLLGLTMTGLITPLTLLILIFLIEMGTAFETPAFLAVLPELVPKALLQPALALNGVGINISRIVGPAVGGLVVGAAGVATALAINAATFAAVVFAYMGHVRRRDGALFWEHFADTADPARHVEVFIAESWLEHLREHERITVADRALEDELRRFQVGDTAPLVTHLISARTRR